MRPFTFSITIPQNNEHQESPPITRHAECRSGNMFNRNYRMKTKAKSMLLLYIKDIGVTTIPGLNHKRMASKATRGTVLKWIGKGSISRSFYLPIPADLLFDFASGKRNKEKIRSYCQCRHRSTSNLYPRSQVKTSKLGANWAPHLKLRKDAVHDERVRSSRERDHDRANDHPNQRTDKERIPDRASERQIYEKEPDSLPPSSSSLPVSFVPEPPVTTAVSVDITDITGQIRRVKSGESRIQRGRSVERESDPANQNRRSHPRRCHRRRLALDLSPSPPVPSPAVNLFARVFGKCRGGCCRRTAEERSRENQKSERPRACQRDPPFEPLRERESVRERALVPRGEQFPVPYRFRLEPGIYPRVQVFNFLEPGTYPVTSSEVGSKFL